MKVRKIIFMILVAITVNSIATSCSNDDKNLTALENEKNLALNAESSKEQFVNELNAAFGNSANTRATGTPILSNSQKRFLQQSAVKMLKDENMYSTEIDKLAKQNDLGVIFVGVLYLGIVDTNGNTPNGFLENRAYKTRSESSSGECYSVAKLQSCLHKCIVEAVGLGIVTSILNGYINQCLTKVIVKQILSKVAGAVVSGGVSLTVDLTRCVFDCMDIV